MARSLQPEQAIDGWRNWSEKLSSRPVLLDALHGGRSNRSFLLESDAGKLVLRINGPGSLLPGASRSNEIRTWQAASTEGLAPPLLFVESNDQYLVSQYIENDLGPHPQTNTAIIDEAFRLLEGCHNLDVRTSPIDYFSHIAHYWQLIEAKKHTPDPALAKQRQPMYETLESLIKSNTPTGLCHHDPVMQNFVGTSARLYLIDWEYAATGLQIMDYAALATEWQLDDETVLEHTKFSRASLSSAKSLYQYLCLLWEEATV
jgi:thiamine kinase-like enzyme